MSTAMSKHLVLIAATLLLIGCKVEPLKITRTKTSVSNGLTFNYMVENVSGWDVIVEDTIWLERPKLTREILETVYQSLSQIALTLPENAVEHLRLIPIYITDTKSSGRAAHVHRSEGWLRAHGEDEEKVDAVDVCDPDLLRPYLNDQPWMILHELTHAFEQRFSTAEERDQLRQLHQQVKDAGKYGQVPYLHGMRQSYAATDPHEYLAESSEAYWGRNDFFPFDREDLKKYDSNMYEFVEEFWTRKRE
jgi:hypothetical protein